MPPAHDSERDEVRDAYQAYLDAMRDGDTVVLDALLDESFTLTHISGYLQPKAEWLAEIRAGQFAYHTVQQHDLSIDTSADSARLVGRILTDATVYGHRAHWHLALTMDYRRDEGHWLACRAVATLWR